MLGYLDESYEARSLYVLVLVPGAAHDDRRRAALRALLLGDGQRLHTSKEKKVKRRLRLSESVAELDVRPVVAVRESRDALERARGFCLSALAWHVEGIDEFVFERRGSHLDAQDKRRLARMGRHHGPRIAARFMHPEDEPMLWVADIVAAAVFQDLFRGNPIYRAAIGPITLLDC